MDALVFVNDVCFFFARCARLTVLEPSLPSIAMWFAVALTAILTVVPRKEADAIHPAARTRHGPLGDASYQDLYLGLAPAYPAGPPPGKIVMELRFLVLVQFAASVLHPLCVYPDAQGPLLLAVGLFVSGPIVAG